MPQILVLHGCSCTIFNVLSNVHWSLQATSIVDNVHLHLLPSMNPDGFSLRRRGNANNVDLNRDFPDQVLSEWQDLVSIINRKSQ